MRGRPAWMPSDRRGFAMLATLAIVSAFSAYVEFYPQRRCALVDRRVDHTCELAIRLFRDHPRE